MTIKTENTLYQDYPDNALRGTASEITASKLRDFVDSVTAVGATLYCEDVTQAVTGNWAKVTCFTNSIDTKGINEDLPEGEVVVGSGADGTYFVYGVINLEFPANGQVEVAITKNEAITPYKAKMQMKIGEPKQLIVIGSGNLVATNRIGLAIKGSGSVTGEVSSAQLSIGRR